MPTKIKSGTGFMPFSEFCEMINGAVKAGDKLQAEVDAGIAGSKEYLEMISKPLREQ